MGAKREPPLCVRKWLKKDRKKLFAGKCRSKKNVSRRLDA